MPASAKPTLMVIDGHSLAFRAFYALPVDSFQTRDGQHTNAIHGFISMLLKLVEAERPDYLGVAFDVSRSSFRTREYEDYKATRSQTPPEFLGQVPLLREALAAMNVPTLDKEDFEADDILATFARRGRERGLRVLVVSGDRDAIQLVNDDVTLLYPSRQGVTDLTRYDTAKVAERYGIRPEQYPEIAALVGETSDNLPGIPRVGEKTAVKWLHQFGTLEEIIARRDEIGGKVGESLREHYENALRNRRLNRLIDDVELPVDVDALALRPVDVDAVREVFAKLEFRALLGRVLALAGVDAAQTDPTPAESAGPAVGARPAPQAPVGEELRAWLEREGASHPEGLGLRVAPADAGGLVVGIAAGLEAVELEWTAGRGELAPLEEWLAGDAPKIVHDAKAQIKLLAGPGLALGGIELDTLIAAGLLRPATLQKSLDDLVSTYLEETVPRGDPNQLVPAEETILGPAGEAWFAWRLGVVMAERMDESTRRVYESVERPVIPILAGMELAGISVDHGILSDLSAELATRAADLAQQSYAVIGREFNLGSPKQLQEVLFDQLGLPKTRALKTGYSTDAAALVELKSSTDHPILDLLLAHRDATKLRQIVETVDKSIGPDGRVHTSYQQIGATTGRLSSTDPNLQNIPARTDEGRRIRQAFQVGEGYETLLTADYSQIEMRIMAHLSQDPGLIEAFRAGEDLHSFVGARVFGVPEAEVTPTMRTKVKAMSYGLAYGLSAFGLSRQLGIEQSEAKQLMAEYFTRFGAVRDYLRGVVEQAKIDRYTRTVYGRKRFFPELASPNRQVRDNAERAALNAPIQGTAADLMKLAMIAVRDALRAEDLRSRMLLQVHDELVFEVAPGEFDALSALVVREMTGVATLDVPLDVHVGGGPDWDAAGH